MLYLIRFSSDPTVVSRLQILQMFILYDNKNSRLDMIVIRVVIPLLQPIIIFSAQWMPKNRSILYFQIIILFRFFAVTH